MQSKARVSSGVLAILGLVVLAASLASATSCDRLWSPSPPTPTATRTLSSPALTPAATPAETPVTGIPLEILSARDALLVFLRNGYPDKAPPNGLVWSGRDTTPPGVRGISTYEFTGDSWSMTVAAVSISPTEIVYETGLDNAQTGMRWTGKFDATYDLLESNWNVAVEVLVVRETVLAWVREHYAGQAPAENLVWLGARTTLFGMAGRETCQFVSASGKATAGGWTMTVGYEPVPPAQVVYEVDLRQAGTGFVWRGQVDAEGAVLEHR